MPTTDFAMARRNMVDGQVRTNDVTDLALVGAMTAVSRELFVAPGREPFAYMGEAVEAARGRFLLEPRAFAKLAHLAAIRPSDSILVVGGATGYAAAVFARLAAKVTLLESDSALAQAAADLLPKAGAASVGVETGPLTAGWAAAAPYDVIFLDGAVSHRPDALIAQLRPGGRLVGIVTDAGLGKAHIYSKTHSGISSRIAFDAGAAMLPGFETAPSFSF